jgi:plasmid stabilization system protein ParE
MYKLSEAAASDIEAILTRSVLDFGVERTETYFQSITHCLELLGDNPEMGKHCGRHTTGLPLLSARKPCDLLYARRASYPDCSHFA